MALVGHYLQSFALMEAALNSVIATALKLDVLQKAVVCKNIQLRDKIKIGRTLAEMVLFSPDERTRFDKLFIKLGSISQLRNMFAHDMFLPDPKGGGVEFFVTKASADLQFPDTTLSVDEIEERCDDLSAISEDLDALAVAIKSADAFRSVAKALIEAETDASMSPIAEALMRGGLDQALRQALEAPDSTPQESTGAKAPETPLDPLE